jgi:hypothetical protein
MTTPGRSSNLNPVLALVLGWILPGAGHAYSGRWGKAVLFFVAINGLLVGGMVLGGGTVIQKSLWLAAQSWAGGPVLALWPISHYYSTLHPIDWANHLHETGILYTAVAGFLNLLIMMDAYLKVAFPSGEDNKEDA